MKCYRAGAAGGLHPRAEPSPLRNPRRTDPAYTAASARLFASYAPDTRRMMKRPGIRLLIVSCPASMASSVARLFLPSFVGATLLLFTNAFSAYATAKALVSQGSPLIPLQIGGTFTSEVILGQENLGKAMALAMVVVVAIVMALYAWLDKRASRWMQR